MQPGNQSFIVTVFGTGQSMPDHEIDYDQVAVSGLIGSALPRQRAQQAPA